MSFIRNSASNGRGCVAVRNRIAKSESLASPFSTSFWMSATTNSASAFSSRDVTPWTGAPPPKCERSSLSCRLGLCAISLFAIVKISRVER